MQSVITILDDIAAGRLAPAEALKRAFDAIGRDDGKIGAFETVADRNQCLNRSHQGPLAGIAVGVKDIFDTHDMVTGYGSPIFDGHRPRTDAAIVAMARAAGATVIGKTVTTEFAFFHPGKTRNPLNLDHTPGGSSSGSAAAVAAGMVPAAIGTQTGGSVVRPAAFCGIAGFKPSYRLVPVAGMKPFSWSLDTAGFFAASVADVALFASRVTRRSLNASSLAEPPVIGLYRTGVWDEADSDMKQALLKAAEMAEAAGARVMEIDEPRILAEARDIHSTIQDFEGGLALGGEFSRFPEMLSDKLRSTLAAGRNMEPEQYDRARSTARKARKAANRLFDEVDVLLTPSTPGAAPKGIETTGVPTFNKLWTLTGSPCVNVPGAKNADGLPLGMQIVGRFGRDNIALTGAAWLENVLAGGREP